MKYNIPLLIVILLQLLSLSKSIFPDEAGDASILPIETPHLQPKILYTYVNDYNELKHAQERLKRWSSHWKENGWQIQILTEDHVKQHSKFEYFEDLIRKNGLRVKQRERYYRYIAMASLFEKKEKQNIRRGRRLDQEDSEDSEDSEDNSSDDEDEEEEHEQLTSLENLSAVGEAAVLCDQFVFSLHNAEMNLPIDNTVDLLYYNSYDDSLLYGTSQGWSKALGFLFQNPTNLDPVAFQLLQQKHKSASLILNIDSWTYRMSNALDMSKGAASRVSFKACELAREHFAIRFIPDKRFSQEDLEEKILRDYHVQCVLDRGTYKDLAKKFQIPLSQTESMLHQRNIVNEKTESRVDCHLGACHVQNACVTGEGGLMLFSADEQQFKGLQSKFKHITKQTRFTISSDKHIPITKGVISKQSLKSTIATMGMGYFASNKYHVHALALKYALWPLIRLHTTFRPTEDIVQDTFGNLYLHEANSIQSHANNPISIYQPLSQQLIDYSLLTHEQCYKHLYVGTSSMLERTTENLNRDLYVLKASYYNAFNLPLEQEVDTIVIAMEEGTIENILELRDELEKKYTYHVRTILFDELTMRERITLLSRTKLLLTNMRAEGVMNGILMQNKVAHTLIYCSQDKKQDAIDIGIQLEDMEHNFLEFCIEDGFMSHVQHELYGEMRNVNVKKLFDQIQRLRLL